MYNTPFIHYGDSIIKKEEEREQISILLQNKTSYKNAFLFFQLKLII